MAKKIMIIGGGIAGLSAGCYARMNGYDVEIHEAHTLPGGLCTTWKRGEYLFDGCIHWLVGSGPGSELYDIWNELGVIKGRKYIDHEVFSSVTGKDGKRLDFYTDVDRLEAHMKELSPHDADPIVKLCGIIRRFTKFEMPMKKAGELMGFLDGVRIMLRIGPFIKDFRAIGGLSLEGLGSWFEDPFLKSAITYSLFDGSMPAFALIMTLAGMNGKKAGFPIGGSLEFAKTIERRFTDLGGRIVYGSRAEKVLETAGNATGVRFKGGETAEADYIVSALDLRQSLYSLLDGTRIDPAHEELLAHGKLYEPAIVVSFGSRMSFDRDISCIGTSYELETPVTIAGREQRYFAIKNYSYDPGFAPAGKSVVGTMIPTDWDYWEKLSGNKDAYAAEKKKILEICIEQIELRYPGFASSIEESDVATPLTFERYTGNWKGSYMTWQLSQDFQRRHRFVPKTVPGLSGFYIASMWTSPPGGIPGAATAGRGVVQLICKQDKKRFVASTL